MICPSCEGNGEGGMGFVHRATGRCTVEKVRCSTCSGTGEVHDEYPEWKRAGERMAGLRRLADRSLREEARRLGISPADLSAMEHGRKRPYTVDQSTTGKE